MIGRLHSQFQLYCDMFFSKTNVFFAYLQITQVVGKPPNSVEMTGVTFKLGSSQNRKKSQSFHTEYSNQVEAEMRY